MSETAIENTLDAIFQILERKTPGTSYLFADGLYTKEDLTRSGIKAILSRAEDFDRPEKWLEIWKRYFQFNFGLYHIENFATLHFKWN